MKFTRRDFVATTALGSASLALDLHGQNTAPNYQTENQAPTAKPKAPVIICAANGYNYLDRGYAVLDRRRRYARRGDAGHHRTGRRSQRRQRGARRTAERRLRGGTRLLLHARADAHGRLGRGRARHQECLAAGEDGDGTHRTRHAGRRRRADTSASLMGFPRENLLTERSRKTWQLWRETMSNDDWWGPGLASPNFKFPDESGQSELSSTIRCIDKM